MKTRCRAMAILTRRLRLGYTLSLPALRIDLAIAGMVSM
jgi:hypothetical protein